jgi:hypothetical protein
MHAGFLFVGRQKDNVSRKAKGGRDHRPPRDDCNRPLTSNRSNIRRIVLLVCGLVAAAYSVPAAFLNGLAIARGVSGYVTAIAMVGVVIVSLVLDPIALECFRTGDRSRGLMLTAAWLITFPLVVANSIGFTASNRVEAVDSKQDAIEKAQRASAERDRLTRDLTVAQQSPRWEQTSGCPANRSKGASKEYCDRVDEMRQGVQAANKTLDAGRPATSDAMAEQLAWVTGLAPATIQRLMPMWMLVEVAAMAAMIGAFAKAAPAAPERKPKRKAKRKASRRKMQAQKPTLTVVPKWSDDDEIPRVRYRRR